MKSYIIILAWIVLAVFGIPRTIRGEKLNAPKPTLPFLSPAKDSKKVQTSYKNVSKLGHLNEAELERYMGFMTESLGVKCQYCHNEDDYSKDEKIGTQDKIMKDRARDMIEMTQGINQYLIDESITSNRESITCFTCHRGSVVPPFEPEDVEEEFEFELPSLVSKEKDRVLPKEDFKNVHHLNHLTEDEYDTIMYFFTKSIGIKCSDCHDPKHYESDDKPLKESARGMIVLVQDLIPKYFGDHYAEYMQKKDRLLCYTCHQGDLNPARLPDDWEAGLLH